MSSQRMEEAVRSNVSADTTVETEFRRVRAASEQVFRHLETSDFEAQSMPDCSPLKWHLAHTTWFFETFVLREYASDFQPFHECFGYLFNSYYNAEGARQLRPERGLLSRPTLDVVRDYRRNISAQVIELLEACETDASPRARRIRSLVELGCHHEQQHQELMLTDLLNLFSRNAMAPAFAGDESCSVQSGELGFLSMPAGLYEVGHSSDSFSFDNEGPRHRVFLEPFQVADRLVTNAEFEAFIADGGYSRSEIWLDQGFSTAREQNWDKPLYWRGKPGSFSEFSLRGLGPLEPERPVCHVSFYEADAYARWTGARLAREQEWEVAAARAGQIGTLLEDGSFRPRAAGKGSGMRQCFGDVWEWTQSAYCPYPGYRAPAGALGEYNGKFMVNQLVLRGGSCATSRSHIRSTYRNFFYPKDRWQFSGIRLAKDNESAI